MAARLLFLESFQSSRPRPPAGQSSSETIPPCPRLRISAAHAGWQCFWHSRQRRPPAPLTQKSGNRRPRRCRRRSPATTQKSRRSRRSSRSQSRPASRWSGSSSCQRRISARGSASPPIPRAGSSPATRATRGSYGSHPPRSTARSRRLSKRFPCRSPAPKDCSGPSTRSTSSVTADPAAASTA